MCGIVIEKEVSQSDDSCSQAGESQGSLLIRSRKRVNQARILSTVRRKHYRTAEAEQRRIASRKGIRRQRRRQWRQQRWLGG